ncbi:MAG: hypothetical protein ACI4QI_06260 [Candidatus Coproplasma sp.]
MDFTGKTVVHKKHGAGVVIQQNCNRITVKFPDRQEAFILPLNVVIGTIRFDNPAVQTQFNEELVKEQDTAKAAKKLELDKAQQRIVDRANSTTKVARTPRNGRSGSTNSTPHARGKHIAFKCNYCDGGNSANCLGFKGVCSDEKIEYNVHNHAQSWCAHPDCPCRQYSLGQITRPQLDATHANGNFTCYESVMLTSWKAAAGEDRDGSPRKILSAEVDKIAVLTTVLPGTDEKDRVIFAVFLIGEAFIGSNVQSGYVVGREGFTIELTPNEAKQLKFWNYYSNKNLSIAWKQGLFHYLTRDVCKNILDDIIKMGGDNARIAQELLAYV